MLNLSSLSTSEIVRYADNGTIDAIPANVFLSIIREYEEKLSDAEAEKSQQGYDNGYDDGWESAVRDVKNIWKGCKEHLEGM